MTRNELNDFMVSCGVMAPNYYITDNNYRHPTRDWLFNRFAPATQRNLQTLGILEWSAENNDCDDFANTVKTWAAICHKKTPGSEGTALAVGSFFYVRGTQGHAIICAVIYDGDKPQLVFIEPQTGTQANLTQKEIDSCVYFYF